MENTPNNELLKTIQSLLERVTLLERAVGGLIQQRGGTLPTASHAPAPASSLPSTPPTTRITPTKPRTSTEMEIGQKWLSIVGVVLVFLAALFFVQFVFKYIGPVGKIALSYAGAALLFGVAVFTKKKYALFSGVVGAGAWGITYLVTYAMYFFPATRIITAAPIAMLLLAAVVGALVIVALHLRSKPLLALALVLGVLTVILSPLSLFSIIGIVLLLAVFVALAILMPWGDFILPATIGAYLSYACWFTNVLGRLPAQGGGLQEKQIIGLVALVIMWLLVAAGLVLRKDEEKAIGGQADTLTLILASAGTALLGLFALQELILTLASPRLARATWLLLVAVMLGGWALLAYEFRQKKDAVIAGGIIGLLLLMASIAYFLPEQSSGTTLAWAALGLLIIIGGLALRSPWLGAISSLALVASAIRFIASDMQKEAVKLSPDFSLNVLIGLIVAIVITGSAALLRTLDVSALGHKQASRLSGVLLAVGLVVLYAMTAQEFSGPLPSVIWGLAGVTTVLAGFLVHWRDARLVGLLGLAATVGRVFLHDLQDLEALPRVISFAILGGLLLLAAYGYNHNKEKLQKYLEEEHS